MRSNPSRRLPLWPALLFLASVLAADEPPGDPELAAAAADPAPEDGATAGEAGAPANPCLIPARDDMAWIDWIENSITRSVCSTARWFDGFFGDSRYDDESDLPYGWLSVEPIWNEFDGLDARVDFRVSLRLPNLDRRYDAFFGRDDVRDVVTGVDDSPDPAHGFDTIFDRDQELFLGLGYRARSDLRRRIDYRVGVKLGFPMNPFVQARFRRHHFFGDRTLVRLRQTVFWEGEDGAGATVTGDYERILTDRLMVRWASSGTFSEGSRGVEWRSNLVLFHSLAGRRAMAYELRIEGESDAPVPTRAYGFRATYRESVLREWLFGEVVAGLSWPREEPYQARDAVWVLGIGAEIFFGKRQ